MKNVGTKRDRLGRPFIIGIIALCFVSFGSCKRTTSTGGIDILGSSDQTAEAGQTVAAANEDLKKIKVLYEANIGKREELKKALETNNAEDVKRLTEEIGDLIDDGKADGMDAINKLQQAQEMQINADYREYLRLKEESIKKEVDAFENYRQAARALHNNYDPKSSSIRDKVKEEFKARSDNYSKIMDSARADSAQANVIAKEALKKQTN